MAKVYGLPFTIWRKKEREYIAKWTLKQIPQNGKNMHSTSYDLAEKGQKPK